MPMTPAPDEVLTIVPPPLWSSAGHLVLHAVKTPARLTDTRRSKSAVRDVGQGGGRLLDAGVVEGRVEPTEGGQRRLDRCLHLLG